MAAFTVLKDGYPTLYTFSACPSIELEEIEVTPIGLDSGGNIDQTNMRSSRMRTGWPKQLLTTTGSKATVAYDPKILNTLKSYIGVNQQITITYPDGSYDQFWGQISKFTRSSHKEGDRPTGDIEIEPTNLDNSGNEQAPTYTA